MTEVLTQEEIVNFKNGISAFTDMHGKEFNPGALTFDCGDMQKALNTIEDKDKEIEALKGQVAALRNTLYEYPCQSLSKISYEIAIVLENTQQTAQAFETSIRKDEREKAIRGCIAKCTPANVSYYSEPLQVDIDEEMNILTSYELEALLTKEQE